VRPHVKPRDDFVEDDACALANIALGEGGKQSLFDVVQDALPVLANGS
jgi:hypothetical protein